MQKINRFENEYAFLSNFYETPVMYNNILWRTSEHAYQAAKTDDPIAITEIANCRTPGQAKRLGQKVKLKSDWDKIKIGVMKEIISNKFKNINLIDKLMETLGMPLIEGNHWHDNFWGDCNCSKCKNIKGQNHLGKILMSLRGF